MAKREIVLYNMQELPRRHAASGYKRKTGSSSISKVTPIPSPAAQCAPRGYRASSISITPIVSSTP
jgi:hypothetical protein